MSLSYMLIAYTYSSSPRITIYLTESLGASCTDRSKGWNLPNLGDLLPSVIVRRQAQIEPPTQYWKLAKARLEAHVESVDLECHSKEV